MKAFYNEIDRYCCDWLSNLMDAGHITPGTINDRPIQELSPDDIPNVERMHFFAGIGGWDLALNLAGWADGFIWTGSCPCQPFSAAGKGKAADDKRHLWPAWFRLIRECKPSVIFGEQVAAAIGHGWLDLVCADLEGEGYACGAAVLPACGVSASHIRQRLWFVAQSTRERSSPKSQGRLRGELQAGFRQPSQAGLMGYSNASGQQARKPQSIGNGTRPKQSSKSGASGLVAHAADCGCEPVARERRVPTAQTGNESVSKLGIDGQAGSVADAECGSTERRRHDVAGASEDPEREARQRQRLWTDTGTGEQSGLVGNAKSDGQRQSWITEAGDGQQGEAGRSSPWSDLEWLPCSDGKARPAKPGIFPLASGVPARVAKLRAAGNSIVPQCAQAFIEAVMESGNV